MSIRTAKTLPAGWKKNADDRNRRFRIPSHGPVTAEILDALDGHRQRQAFALLAERYGWNLQPAAEKTTPTPSHSNRSEFAAIEAAADELDQLSADRQNDEGLLVCHYVEEAAVGIQILPVPDS